MRRLVCLLAASALLASAESPRLFYSKSFPGSVPAFVAITVEQGGRAEYREAADDQDPLLFDLTAEETAELFALAGKLGKFTRPLEANLKVARTGVKTFRFEEGKEKHEIQFNYSLDPDAQRLLDWFERIAETEQRRIALERAAKYDKLGVNQALLLLEVAWNRKRLVAPRQLLPTLDRIARNESYLHMARARAASLAEAFRAGKPAGDP